MNKSVRIRIKNSKPVLIVAHSNELVVPVKYAHLVKKFLKSKKIKLPQNK